MGDQIEYYHPVGVMGSKEWLRKATVHAVRPDNDHPLVLCSGDLLPRHWRVKILKHNDESTGVNGKFITIARYQLVKSGNVTQGDSVARYPVGPRD